MDSKGPAMTTVNGMTDSQEYRVPQTPEKLSVIAGLEEYDGESASAALLRDDIVLVRGVRASEADDIIAAIAERFGLREQLELQAAFASVRGHRSNISKYFMSVNARSDYHFILSHSEGDFRTNMQLAAFYCYENSTDGGSTVLQNVDAESPAWEIMREVAVRIDFCGRKPTASELARAKMLSINYPDDVLRRSDQVLSELQSPFPGAKCYTVLGKPEKARSRILGRDYHAYWDNIASTDADSGREFMRLLKSCGLLKEPAADTDAAVLDNTQPRKAWSSGIKYEQLFKGMIIRKLEPGDLILQNNLTWTHGASNWTPGSGNRNVAAAFA